MSDRALARIDLGAIERNCRELKSRRFGAIYRFLRPRARRKSCAGTACVNGCS